MSSVIFDLSDDLIVTVPVVFQVPTSVKTNGVKPEQSYVKRTIYLNMRVPQEDEIEAVQARVNLANAEIFRRRAALAEAEKTASAEEQAEIDRERQKLTEEIRLGQEDMLVEFTVGLPDGHGVGENGAPAEFSPDLIRRMCQRRFLREAMSAAWLKLLNGPGDAKKGN
jgi:hypothetical protein